VSITVVNVRDHAEGAIYVGRGSRGRAASALGNPYRIGHDGNRAEVIEKYRGWLTGWIDNGMRTGVHDEFDRLVALYRERGSLVLSCWCKPLDCHADVLAAAIEKRARA
jgi:Domain of unknown function (DUF4326)